MEKRDTLKNSVKQAGIIDNETLVFKFNADLFIL